MTISLQFTAEEILLLIKALNLASIHSTDDILSNRMTIIQRKLESLRQINNEY